MPYDCTSLEIKDISYAYHTKSGETPALSQVSFQVFPGEFAAVVGPSGCGNATVVQEKQKGKVSLSLPPRQVSLPRSLCISVCWEQTKKKRKIPGPNTCGPGFPFPCDRRSFFSPFLFFSELLFPPVFSGSPVPGILPDPGLRFPPVSGKAAVPPVPALPPPLGCFPFLSHVLFSFSVFLLISQKISFIDISCLVLSKRNSHTRPSATFPGKEPLWQAWPLVLSRQIHR